MTATAIRTRLQEYLEVADSKKVKAFYTMLETEIEDTLSNYSLSPEQMKEVEKRRKSYLSGKSKTYSWEDAKSMIVK